MQSSGKAYNKKTFEMPLNLGLKTKENYESWENLFKKTMSKEPLFSFSRTSENPIHWIQLLDPFDQHDLSKSLKRVNDDAGPKIASDNPCSSDSRSDSKANSTKGSKGYSKGPQTFSGEKMPSLKIPEAVVALAQVAAKATGESLFGGSTDFSEWPLIPPAKIPLLKCEKCSLEFYSPLNHRRHIRMIHRRPGNTEKEDCSTLRQQLAAFWDSLSPEVAMNTVSCSNLVLEDLTGDILGKALTSLLQQPGLFSLPLCYAKAGASLLELVYKKLPRSLPGSSELLKILDESSEKTFPSFACGSMHRYVFENGVRKVGLEIKNLVASLGFLVEQNLVKAWLNNKDAEALRCQMALVEEEEASQRKQAEIQERKRLKKVRQKEMRDKEKKPAETYLDMQQLPGDDVVDGCLPVSEKPALDVQLRLPSGSMSDISTVQLEASPVSSSSENIFCRLAGDESSLDDLQEVVPGPLPNLCKDDQGCVERSEDNTSLNVQEHQIKDLQTELEGDGPLVSTGAQKSDSEQKRRIPVAFKRSSSGGYTVGQKFKHTWRERKWPESNSLKSYQKQPEKGLYGFHMGDDRKGVRKYATIPSKTMEGASVLTSPRSIGHSSDRALATKRHQSNTGSGHAVWARKVQIDKEDDKIVFPEKKCQAEESVHQSSLIPEESMPVLEDSSTSSSTCAVATQPTREGDPSSEEVDCHLEAEVACDSLVIGSLNVPLAIPGCDPLNVQQMSRSEVCEVMVAKDVDAVSNKRLRNEGSEVAEAQGNNEELFGALLENGVSQLVSHKDSAKDNRAFKFQAQMDPECKENHRQQSSDFVMQERPSRIAVRYPRIWRSKVWRPVSMPSPKALLSELKASDIGDSSVCGQLGDDTTVQKTNGADSSRECPNQHIANCRAKSMLQGQENEEVELMSTSGCDEALSMSPRSETEGAALEAAEPYNRLENTTSEPIVVLLSQRWMNAVDSTEAVVYAELEYQYQSPDGTVHVNSSDLENRTHASNGHQGKYWHNRSKFGQGEQGWIRGRDRNRQASRSGPSGYKYIPK